MAIDPGAVLCSVSAGGARDRDEPHPVPAKGIVRRELDTRGGPIVRDRLLAALDPPEPFERPADP
jgi:hypothetical protein